MAVNFILNFMRNPNMNFILVFEVIRIKPTLKLNEILNQALLKDKIEEIVFIVGLDRRKFCHIE